MPITDPAVASTLLFLLAAPIGLYFLLLGLLASGPRPVRLSSRQDFILLAVVTVPILIAPIPPVAGSRAWPILIALAAVAGWAWRRLAPTAHAGWAVYHLTESQWRVALADAASAAGWTGRWRGRAWVRADGRTLLRYAVYPVLRIISVQLRPSLSATPVRARLETLLDQRLSRIEQLPAASGLCLTCIGVALLSAPVWVLGHNAPALAAAFARLLG